MGKDAKRSQEMRYGVLEVSTSWPGAVLDSQPASAVPSVARGKAGVDGELVQLYFGIEMIELCSAQTMKQEKLSINGTPKDQRPKQGSISS